MHKMRLNRLELNFTLKPDGPILLKSGIDGGMTKDDPNMEFMSTVHPTRGGRTVFLPGSSLKGALRSHAERIARTVGMPCCDPLDHSAQCNSDMKSLTGAEVYRRLCTVCRLFGSTNMASHFVVKDAYPTRAVSTDALDTRDMVAINRTTGAVQNPFKLRVATETPFRGTIVLENFERWQLGLLALVLRDLAAGAVRIGHGKTRGLGCVTVVYRRLRLSYPAIFRQTSFHSHIYGVAELAAEPELEQQELANLYGWLPWSFSQEDDFAAEVTSDGWGVTNAVVTDHSAIENALRHQVEAWLVYMRHQGVEVLYE